jgi:SAM-dependent methyltransferase
VGKIVVDDHPARFLTYRQDRSGGRLLSEALLRDIAEFCRRSRMAESTFGRLAVNDGKLVSRLRLGGRVTTDTVDRVHAFIAQAPQRPVNGAPMPALPVQRDPGASVPGNFRFYDNRQKYLLFVTTCSEKWVIAERVGMELANIHPRPPALRLFDAGMGDGTVLARTMRAMHARFPTMPFHIVGKEISLEDVRLVLEKMPDRLFEHPATVLVMTNMYYSEAPWLKPNSVNAATSLVWHELSLSGNTAHEFETQVTELGPFLTDNWRARMSRTSGNPVYEKPVVLVIYREDHKFLLDQVRPRRGFTEAEFDLIIASQPYRARAPLEFKARRVVAPLARALAPGGRLIAIHSHGNDPGLDIIRRIWPGENPFTTDRHALLRATKTELGHAGRDLNFGAYADARSLFRYDMHTLPSEISETIGTSTLFAAWNAAIYVAQIEDQRLSEAVSSGAYLEATQSVLQEHGGLWFWDESFVISRKRDSG